MDVAGYERCKEILNRLIDAASAKGSNVWLCQCEGDLRSLRREVERSQKGKQKQLWKDQG